MYAQNAKKIENVDQSEQDIEFTAGNGKEYRNY